jgi:hypothetical protein
VGFLKNLGNGGVGDFRGKIGIVSEEDCFAGHNVIDLSDCLEDYA